MYFFLLTLIHDLWTMKHLIDKLLYSFFLNLKKVWIVLFQQLEKFRVYNCHIYR